MHIWYFSPYAGGPNIGGAMRAFHLARLWGEMGYGCTVFPARFHHLLTAGKPLPPVVTVDGVRYVSLPAREYVGNGTGRLLNMLDYCLSMRSINEPAPDAIIVSSPHPFGIFPGARLAKKHGATLAFEVRDLWPLSLTEIAGVPRWHPFVQLTAFAERYAYRRADVVASLLRDADQHMVGKGVDPSKFIYVRNGIDPDAPEPLEPTSPEGRRAAQVLRSWHIEGRKAVIHPGSQGVPNALDGLVIAAHELGDDFGVLLVGKGTETERLKAMAGPNVRFFPAIPKSEALWLTKNSDIGYAGGRNLPIYRFGTSFNKVADFVRFGLPVVEIIDTGAGVVARDETPSAIASAIREAATSDRATIKERHEIIRRSMDYRSIAERYAQALRRTR